MISSLPAAPPASLTAAGEAPGRAGWACGVLTVVVFLATTPFATDEPGADASTRAAVEYWTTHASTETALSVVFTISAAALVAFGATLRAALRRAEHGRDVLPSVAFAGTILAAAGLLLAAGLSFGAADTAGKVPAEVTQTLSVLNQELFFSVGVGFALMMIGGGIVAIRTAVLPPWFGWLSVVIALTVFTPAGFLAYIAVPVWILFVCFMLGLRHGAAGAD
jgi:hypothetical protein